MMQNIVPRSILTVLEAMVSTLVATITYSSSMYHFSCLSLIIDLLVCKVFEFE